MLYKSVALFFVSTFSALAQQNDYDKLIVIPKSEPKAAILIVETGNGTQELTVHGRLYQGKIYEMDRPRDTFFDETDLCSETHLIGDRSTFVAYEGYLSIDWGAADNPGVEKIVRKYTYQECTEWVRDHWDGNRWVYRCVARSAELTPIEHEYLCF